MDLIVQANALRMALQFFDGKEKIENIIPYQPQKKPMPKEGKINLLPRAKPEELGIKSEYLDPLIYNLSHLPELDLDTLQILVKGQVIAESYLDGYSNNRWSITHSMCKSITVLAILILIDQGKLDLKQRLVDLLDDGNVLTPVTHKDLTVRHLLTMSSGIVFNEIGAITSEDWTKDFMESGFRFEPGQEFHYNSMNSYMLSYLVKKLGGLNLSDFLKTRLFTPLGIEVFDWELSPQGIEKGGWGMYLAPEDMAKIGMLFCQKGVYQDQVIISQELMEAAMSGQTEVPHSFGNYDYGYHCWVSRHDKSVLLNGMFGQNVAVFPESEIVIVATAGTNAVFQQGEYFRYIRRYFEGFKPAEQPLPENPEAHSKLLELKRRPHKLAPQDVMTNFLGAAETEKLNRQYFDGSIYEFETGEAHNVSFVPMVQQILRNGYSRGLQALTLMDENTMVFLQGDELLSVEIGFDQSKLNQIETKEETYTVGAFAAWSKDVEGNFVLTCRFSLVETASSRFLTLVFKEEELALEFYETPGREMIYRGLSNLNEELARTKTLEELLVKIEEDVLSRRVDQLFNPKSIGKLRK